MKFFRSDPDDRGWRGAPLHWQIAHVVGIVLPGLIFWFAPDDVLTSCPALSSVTGVMKEWIPSVRKLAEFSLFPQVAELGMSSIFICALLLVPVFVFGKTMAFSRSRGHQPPTDPKQIRNVYLVALIIIPICIAGVFLIGPDTPTEASELLNHQGGRFKMMYEGIYLDSRLCSGIMASLLSPAMAASLHFEILVISNEMDKLKG